MRRARTMFEEDIQKEVDRILKLADKIAKVEQIEYDTIVRELCDRILDSAGVNGYDGCLLCQS